VCVCVCACVLIHLMFDGMCVCVCVVLLLCHNVEYGDAICVGSCDCALLDVHQLSLRFVFDHIHHGRGVPVCMIEDCWLSDSKHH
jgi:hypothetical protein